MITMSQLPDTASTNDVEKQALRTRLCPHSHPHPDSMHARRTPDHAPSSFYTSFTDLG